MSNDYIESYKVNVLVTLNVGHPVSNHCSQFVSVCSSNDILHIKVAANC